MTAFESIGVGYQYSAKNKKEAKRNLQKSCTSCATKGKRIVCERCAIAAAHKDVVTIILN